MKRLLCVILLLLLLPLAARAEFLASRKSQVYHRPTCRWVARIAPEYRVKFTTRDAAWAAGYRPCDTCRPPGLAAEPRKKRAGQFVPQGATK